MEDIRRLPSDAEEAKRLTADEQMSSSDEDDLNERVDSDDVIDNSDEDEKQPESPYISNLNGKMVFSGYGSTRKVPMTGLLQIYSGFFQGWRQYEVSVFGRILRYAEVKSNGSQEQKGMLNFDLYGCSIQWHESDFTQFSIQVNMNDKTFQFKAASQADAVAWFKLIKQEISESEQRAKRITLPKAYPFWKLDHVTEEQFLEQSDTFDIILFQSTPNFAKLQRAYTGSKFGKYPRKKYPTLSDRVYFNTDHCAMIVKFGFEPEDVYLLEAANGEGVFVQRYLELKAAFKGDKAHYNLMAWRQLNFQRTDN